MNQMNHTKSRKDGKQTARSYENTARGSRLWKDGYLPITPTTEGEFA